MQCDKRRRHHLHDISAASQKLPGPSVAPHRGSSGDYHPGSHHRHLREAQEA